MPPLDVKKIITSFLALAAAAGIFAFVFSSFSLPSAPPPKSNITATASSPDKPAGGESSLPAESLPADTFSALNTTSALPAATSTNLTDQLVASMTDQLVMANPEGPQTDDSGNQQLVVPPNLADTLAGELSGATMKFVEIPLDEQRIKINKNPSPEDYVAYIKAVREIFLNTYVNGGIAQLEKQPDDPTDGTIAAMNLVLAQAEEKLYALAAPAPAEKIHRALLSYIEYQKTVFDPAVDSDPVRSLALVQNYDSGIKLRAQDVKNQFNAFVKNPPPSILLKKNTSFLENLILPKTAYAFLGIGDVVSDPFTEYSTAATDVEDTVTAASAPVTSAATVSTAATEHITFLMRVEKEAKTIATQILRQQIIHRLVVQIVNWANTGFKGEPQFINNWEGFMDSVANNAVGVAISNLTNPPGQLCNSFGPLITLQLQQQYLNYVPPFCTLDKVINNVDNFYNSFENGGWLAYGALTMPSGNYYGSLLQAQIGVSNQISKSSQSNKNNAVANSGFPGQKICVQQAKMTIQIAGTDARTLPNGIVVPATPATTQVVDDPNTCAQYQTLTPGTTISNQLGRAMGSTLSSVISAQDIGTLVDAMINGAIVRLIASAKGALSDALKPGPPVPVTANPDPCMNLTGDDLAQCKGLTGTTVTIMASSTDISNDQTQLLQTVKSTAGQLQDALTADANWLEMAPDAKSSALLVASLCNSSTIQAAAAAGSTATMLDLQSDANAAAAAIDAMTPTVQSEIAAIAPVAGEGCTDDNPPLSWTKKIDCLQGDVMSAKTEEDMQLASRLYTDYSEKIQNIVDGSPGTRYRALQGFKQTADADGKPATACSQSLPPLSTP